MSILIFLFIFIIAIILLGLSLISSILRAIFGIFGLRHRTASATGRQEQSRTQTTKNSKNTPEEGGSKKKKLIQKDEGEYVDFEEIK
jgi:Sec-independent protein translocase protein TatA